MILFLPNSVQIKKCVIHFFRFQLPTWWNFVLSVNESAVNFSCKYKIWCQWHWTYIQNRKLHIFHSKSCVKFQFWCYFPTKPEHWIALWRFFPLLVTAAFYECSFSKQKQIKTYLQSSQTQEHAFSIAIISIKRKWHSNLTLKILLTNSWMPKWGRYIYDVSVTLLFQKLPGVCLSYILYVWGFCQCPFFLADQLSAAGWWPWPWHW